MNHLFYLPCPANVPLKCTTKHPELHDFILEADVCRLAQDPDTWGFVVGHITIQSWHIITEPGDIKRLLIITCVK